MSPAAAVGPLHELEFATPLRLQPCAFAYFVGEGPWAEGEWTYVEDPVTAVRETNGLTKMKQTAPYSDREVEKANQKISKMRSSEVAEALPRGENQWSNYGEARRQQRRKAS